MEPAVLHEELKSEKQDQEGTQAVGGRLRWW